MVLAHRNVPISVQVVSPHMIVDTATTTYRCAGTREVEVNGTGEARGVSYHVSYHVRYHVSYDVLCAGLPCSSNGRTTNPTKYEV